MTDEDALTFRKLLDARTGETVLSDQEIDDYHARVTLLARVVSLGPNAFVVPGDGGHTHEPMFRVLFLTRKREIRVFVDIDEAMDWVTSQPLPTARPNYLDPNWTG